MGLNEMLGIDYSGGTFCAPAIVIASVSLAIQERFKQNPISRKNNIELVAVCYKLMAINNSLTPPCKGLPSTYD